MPIHDARIAECGACERRFDLNYPSRMREYQKLHRKEQPHLYGPAACGFLQRKFYDRGMRAELYDTPWDKAPRNVWFCSDECEEAYTRSGSFDYASCEGCGRDVCQQNPSNGWMWQFRTHADLGEICLRCYEKEILGNGQPRSDFENSRINGGMFFSYGNGEAHNAGFWEVDGYENYFINDSESAHRFNMKALSLVDSGHKVITGYERLAIGGLEGYATMLAKKSKQDASKQIASHIASRRNGRMRRI